MSLSYDDRPRGSCAGAFAWILGLSILLCWVPVIGPFLAGLVGGRKARWPGTAIAAAIVPAALWAGLLWWVAGREIHLRGQMIQPGALVFLAPVVAAAIISGALIGASGLGGRFLGAIILVGAVVWFFPHARDIHDLWNFFNQSKTASSGPETQGPTGCPDNLKKLYNAAMQYADSWDGTLPPADHWMSALTDPTQPFAQPEQLHCPGVPTGQFGYAMNAALSMKRLEDIKDKAGTPLFYDSTNTAKDAHDATTSLPKPGRHSGSDNVVYVDGTVKSVTK